ncbi:hypothetical protein AVEN_159028-1 [Araneus ventricosus]|uniref:Uncharacterized protein n=1 Tax=Araneus ventricosus TaxID=182803 RepID=A0A4Y2BBV6_ARAVE|nr:hypothetical protein AVEN_159028-1 [Araneus ventricosus]
MGRRFKEEILEHFVLPYTGSIADTFILMDDSSQCHRDHLVGLVILTSRFEATRGLFWDGLRNFEPQSDDEVDNRLVGDWLLELVIESMETRASFIRPESDSACMGTYMSLIGHGLF